ncbi:MAG: cupin domain-containing protein, partial [Ktedonobacterales bacterium]
AQYFGLPSDCLALFHVLARGAGWFCVPGYAPAELRTGDAILMPHGEPHTISSEHSTRLVPTPLRAIMPPQPTGELTPIQPAGPGAFTQFLCGYLHCDQRFNPLIGALPPLIVLRRVGEQVDTRADTRADTQATRQDSVAREALVLSIPPGDWLGATLDHMIEEALGAGSGGADMLARLSEILYVEIVRRYMRSLSSADHGWLAGVRDPVVGRTLRLLHERPERDWTVGELADAAAVARSTLAQRFTALIGETPMRYLAAWRIHLAKRLLKETDLRLAEIAGRVGYESEVAFNRAFKRHVGWPPATWRAAGGVP